MKKLLCILLLAMLLSACSNGPAPAPQVVVVTVIVKPTAVQPTAVPPTAIPPEPKRLTAYDWAQAAMPYVEGIYNELVVLQGFTDQMSRDASLSYDSGMARKFADTFDRIARNCRGLEGLNPPLEYAPAHNGLLASCSDFLRSGEAIADFFRTVDVDYLDEALSWLTEANGHIEAAVGSMP